MVTLLAVTKEQLSNSYLGLHAVKKCGRSLPTVTLAVKTEQFTPKSTLEINYESCI